MSPFIFFKGRVALYAILKAMGIKRGDEIILPGFTCVVVPTIIYLGAKPVYVDIDPLTYNIDPDKIEEKITDKTKVILVQHTFGIPADMGRIAEFAKKYNLYVIEDSCHALGSRYKGREVGSFGDAAFFSSQWSKPVTTGLGGWAVINNEQVQKNMAAIYPEFIEPSMREEIMLRLSTLHSQDYSNHHYSGYTRTYRRLSKAGLVIGSSLVKNLNALCQLDMKRRCLSGSAICFKKNSKKSRKSIVIGNWWSLYMKSFSRRRV
jgi:dTDP-4-amino-4,6-dideoxygalactose transaminase